MSFRYCPSCAHELQEALHEETSLDAKRADLIGVYEFHRRNQVIVAYHVVAEGEVRLSEELADYRLVEPAALRPWPPGTGPAVADWMRARGLPVIFQDSTAHRAAAEGSAAWMGARRSTCSRQQETTWNRRWLPTANSMHAV